MTLTTVPALIVSGVALRPSAAAQWDPMPAGPTDICWCGRAAVATRLFPDARHPDATRDGYCADHWSLWVRLTPATP